jgi:outer membrane protein
MKKIAIILFILTIASVGVNAQKFAYVDTQYILDNIPEYKMSQKQLDELSAKWQKEIETKVSEVDRLYKSYQTDAVLLPEDIKKQREEEILQKEKELNKLKKKRFGKDGDLFKKRQELIKPLQDKIYNAIKEMADQRGYSVIFDRAGSLSILYASERYDKSDEILETLGYDAGEGSSSKSSKYSKSKKR